MARTVREAGPYGGWGGHLVGAKGRSLEGRKKPRPKPWLFICLLRFFKAILRENVLLTGVVTGIITAAPTGSDAILTRKNTYANIQVKSHNRFGGEE